MRLRITRARQAVDLGTTGVTETEIAGDFVESLAGSVVQGGSEHLIAARSLEGDEKAVSTRDEQYDDRQLDLGRLQHGGIQVAL